MSFSNDQSSLENQLPLSIEMSQEEDNFRYEFNNIYQKIASAVNSKEGGLYVPQEKTTSMQYFATDSTTDFRNVYRMVVDFGALPDTSSKSVFHNIPNWNDSFILTRAYGAATDRGNFSSLPIPNDGILLEINATDVTITTSNNLSMYTETYIVIEYLKEV